MPTSPAPVPAGPIMIRPVLADKGASPRIQQPTEGLAGLQFKQTKS